MKIQIPSWYLLAIPLALYFGGIGLNELVLCANHGAFPVVAPFYAQGVTPGLDMGDTVHRVIQSSDHLKWLSDWIQIPGVGIASPGDMGIWLGGFLQPYALGAWLMRLWDKNA